MHRRLLSLVRNSPLAFALTVGSGLLAGFLTIGQAYLVSRTVDAVFLDGQALPQVMGFMRLILLIIAARGLFTWLNEVAANTIAVHIKTRLRQQLFDHILELGPSYGRSKQTGDLTAAAVQGIEALDAYFGQYLPQLLISTLVPLSVLLIVFPLDLLSALVLLLTAPLIPFFMFMIGRGAELATGRQYETLSRLSAHFLDSLQGLTTLKLFGQSRAQTTNIARVSNEFRDITLKVLQVTFLSALALELLATLSTAIIAVEVGLRLLYARMEFQPALFILILAPEFYLPLRMLGLRFHAGMAGTSAARKIYQVLDTPLPASAASVDSDPQPPSPMSDFSTIRLRSLSFTYPDEVRPALEDINLEIASGRHVALVGRSGAGKSTLMNLLLRFIEPQAGEILVDQRPLRDIPVESWRQMLAWSPQKPYLLNDTISANIRLGKPGASFNEVQAAARMAHLDEFIESLPAKYETLAGEGGAQISTGQAQRLALARAFLMNAPILLLDEPTSSLDPETEALLEDSMRRLMQGRTVITIAHRLNTIYHADQILVLESGRIIGSGSHRELLESSEPYRRLVSGLDASMEISGQLAEQDTISYQREAGVAVFSSPADPPVATSERGVFLRLLGFLRGSWGWAALAVLLSTLTIASSVALMGTSAWLISMAALHPSIADLGVSVVAVRFFGIARGVFRYLERLVSHNVTFRLLARLRTWFYEKLDPLAPARLADYRAGDLLARIVGDVETLENFYIRVVSPPLTAILIAGGTALFLYFFNPLLALILVTFFLAQGVILPLMAWSASRQAGKRLVRERAELQARLVDGIQGMADLLAFNRGRQTSQQLAACSQAYGNCQRRMAEVSGLQSGLANILSNLGLWVVLFVSIPDVAAGRLEGVMLASLALLTVASFEAVTPLPLAGQMWQVTREAARRLFEVVDATPQVVDAAVPARMAGRQPGSRSGAGLEFSGLTFSYPGRSFPALCDISFELRPGSSVAVVGPSGAGKSSLANLLLRFWDYASGDIRLDGYTIRDYAQEEFRAQIGLVSQDAHFFNTSIYENLRFARRGASRQEIEAAARRAYIDATIMQMPRGYETLVGQHGLRLSGGERQRLAIARLLIKNAPIWILDEPTASLDASTEKLVLKTLFAEMEGRMVLFITHRIVGLENVDLILVMDHGRIVERGRHADLLHQAGLYRRLWDWQNRPLLAAGHRID